MPKSSKDALKGSLPESEKCYGGDISALVDHYQDRSVLGKRKAPADSSAPSRSEPFSPASKRQLLTKTVLPNKSCPASQALPSPPGPPHLIAHLPDIHCIFEHNQICRGVQFELARLISAGLLEYDDITEEKLKACTGSNHEAVSKVREVFFSKVDDSVNDPAFAQEHAAKSPWQEMDREEEALSRGPYEGLGNSCHYPDWYGGKITFCGKLLQVEGTPKSYKIRLEPCRLGSSCRFSRRFGSWSFLRIKIPENILHEKNNDLGVFFRKLFVIWGQVFRACYSKGRHTFLFMTNEMYPTDRGLVSGRMSFEEFIQWHNPLEENSAQLMTKWAARTPLGFSSSVPGPQILRENINFEEDIVSAQGSDMTDGCGLSSRSIHSFLLYNRRLPSLPTAFQFRLAGFKGMFLVRDDGKFDDSLMQVWCRHSQMKIKYPEHQVLDPAILTFDILRTSHMSTPARLKYETIINLAENGVPAQIFADLFKTGIRKIVTELTTWDGPDAMYKLWMAVERAEGVLTERKAREAVGEARFRGYKSRSQEELEQDEDDTDEEGDGLDSAQRSTAWWPDQISGCPSGLAETVMYLLDSGFIPQKCAVLREKLKRVIVTKIESRSVSGKDVLLDLDYCAIAFVVPDPYNVLGPDEIHIKSSSRNLKTEDGLFSDIITGDVLITRNPCKVPSDVRKVKAVEHPLLRNLVDVIVCSIQGHRRLLDFLAGGDYDGDTALVIWASDIVANFQNADDKYSLEPPGLDICFTRDAESGATFLKRVRSWDPNMRIQAMQTYLLGAFSDPSIVGQYSMMHDNSVYERGYGNPRTVKLAAKFCKVLDGPKTGWRVKNETLVADKRQYLQSLGPQWKSNDKKRTSLNKNMGNLTYLKRDKSSPFVKGTFIMDVLLNVALKERERLLGEVEKLFDESRLEPDLDLIEPWTAAQRWSAQGTLAEIKQEDLDIIATHVRNVYEKHQKGLKPRKPKADATGAPFSSLPIEVRQDVIRSVSRAFTSFPQVEDLQTMPDQATIARLRASYAFKYDAEKNAMKGGWSRFPWNVAMRELCAIKATALGPSKTVTNNFYEKFRMSKIQ
ncbi:hypothetical protein BYT27DRAFT_7245092 [Phlegmacium glaucopus]|nr:hypothetical protein BYT27DRAFT_7245092 [Phlegmacium glaucopus]